MIDVIDLKKTFGDLEVLKGINVTINKGDIVVVIGPSGSGKSTFLRCLNCMEDPTSGSIIFNGVDIADMRVDINIHRRHMGMVFQHFNLFNNMTVIENIMMAPVYVRCKELKKAKRKGTLAPDVPKTKAEIKAQARAEALELLRRIGLEDKADVYPSTLSGGQKQRVAIARALATRPKYLLCDEATSALDPNTTQSILHLLKEINQTLGVTIVVITHEMRVIEQICKRVAVIDQSCIAEIGNVSDVFTHPKSDIAKALILPKSPAENLPPCTGKRLRLVFDGSCSNEPVISRITLECHVPVNILFADTRIVEGSIYGHMVIDLPDDPQQFHDVLRWLDHNHISYLQED